MRNVQNRKLKILILGEPKSIHTVRWVSQLINTGWDIRIFCPVAPSWASWFRFRNKRVLKRLSKELEPVVIISVKLKVLQQLLIFIGSGFLGILKLMKVKPQLLNAFYQNLTEEIWQNKLAEILDDFQPDIVHSLAINQEWRNLALPILNQKTKGELTVPWIYSSWGTDLTYYPNLSPKNRSDVKTIVQSVDYYISECKRDYDLAIQYGFGGHFLGYLPAFGGIKIKEMRAHRVEGPVSNRKNIYIKGRGAEDPIGKAMIILDVIEKMHDSLKEYPIYIGQATPSIIRKAKEIKRKYGLNINLLPYSEDPEHVLKCIGSSRISLSYTINDGLPASLVEAMALGAFPIFSNLPSIKEWIKHGENGFLVDLDNPEMLIECFQQALKNDHLVTRADKINAKIVQDKLEYSKIRDRAISIYQEVDHLSKSSKNMTNSKCFFMKGLTRYTIQ
jgi:glycosyltransferase involved in cell wall biosynthesis